MVVLSKNKVSLSIFSHFWYYWLGFKMFVKIPNISYFVGIIDGKLSYIISVTFF